MPEHSTESFYELVCQPHILAAARQILVESYTTAAPAEYAQRVRSLTETAFDRLVAAAASGPSQQGDSFRSVVSSLRQDLFRKDDPGFWFNRIYARYKQDFKPQHRMQRLAPWLRGPRILDFGCGDGLTSLEMHKAGYKPYLTDVLDYRSPAARGLPFRPAQDPAAVAYPGQVFDSAVLFAVLHHVDQAHLPGLLDALRRSARRIILEEDSYAIPEELARQPEPGCDLAQLELFRGLAEMDQRRLLAFIDYFANAITQGIPEMEMPFNFRPAAGWQTLFAEHGLRVEHTLLMGFQRGLFNRSCHVWFILTAE